MEISTKNITGILGFAASVLGFIGIIVTYALNSIKDRDIQFFKTKQKYYNVLLESLIIKLSEINLLEKIKKKIIISELELKELETELFTTKETLSRIEKRLELNIFPEKIRTQKDILESKQKKLIEEISLMKDKKINRELKLSESNKNFCIEASRLPLYASEEVINYIEKSKSPGGDLTLKDFYQLMRKDLSSGKVKKIKEMNFNGTLYN